VSGAERDETGGSAPVAEVTEGGETRGLESIARTADRDSIKREALPEGTRIGRYLVLGCLGGGGGGLVYAAFDPELDRRVALKLLRPGETGANGTLPASIPGASARSTAQARLVREAQAMARLAHPNVTIVHDVGTFGDQVFIAMELVDGGTLRDRFKRRTNRAELLRLLLDAGEGLAAAHDAGLVHRDFKPDNVLVGRDGRARVTDFGLVRATREPGSADVSGSSSVPPPPPSGNDLAAPLTQLGAIMGTPPYMAPEQHDSLDTDARTDQYSYAVTLYEALYGERPFKGLSADIVAKKRRRELPDPPAGAHVPPWQRRILERALSADPDQRFPSMRALLDALRDDPAVRRKRRLRLVGSAIGAVALVVTSFAFARRPHADRCAGAEQLLTGAWDDSTRAAMKGAFAKAVTPSDVLFRSTTRELDAYATAWSAMRHEACEATRVREEQPENVLVLRTTCLDSRLRELRALTSQLASADKAMALKAPQAAADLTSLARCADVAALTEVAPLPKDPAAVADIEKARQDLADAKVAIHLGHDPRATELATDAVTHAQAAHYDPVEAEAHYLRGVSLSHSGENTTAETELLTAFSRALASHSDDVAVDAAMNVAQVENYFFAHPPEGLKWTAIAHGVLDRAGNDDDERAHLLVVESWVHYEMGDGKGAVPLAEEAEHIAESLYGAGDSVQLALFLNALGAAYDKAGRYEDAKRAQERALHIMGSQFGEDHPNYAASLNNVAEVENELEDYADALRHLQKAVELYTRLRGPNHPNTAIVLASEGDALAGLGRCAEALPVYLRAVSINDAKFGADYPDTAHFLAGLGNCKSQLGDAAGADAAFERGLALTQKPDTDPEYGAEVRFQYAKALARRDPTSAKARSFANDALASYAKINSRRENEVKTFLARSP
jgi:serine/threonine protein kinase/tetratricopeptide (TPR) repeat protein